MNQRRESAKAIRILHVEDNPGDARQVKKLLTEGSGDGANASNFVLVPSTRLGEALTVLASDHINMVLADLTLPDSEGLDTINQLRRAAPALPVVVMSSKNDEALALQAVQEGAQDYLVKGRMDGSLLMRTIHHVLERKRAEEALHECLAFNESLLQTFPFGMDIVDEQGNILFMNLAMETAVGKDALGKRCWLVYKDDHIQCAVCPLKQPIELGMSHTFESAGVLGGKVFEISHTGMLFRGQKALLEVFQDITARKRTESETLQRAEQLGLLYDVSLALHQMVDLSAQVDFFLKVSKQSLHADRAEFFQWDEMSNQIYFHSAIGFARGISDQMSTLRFSREDEKGLVAWVAKHRIPVNLPEVSRDPRYIAFDPTVRSGLWVPVQHDAKMLGILAMLSTRPNVFTPQDEQLLMLFANQISVALENTRLFSAEQMRRKELAMLYDLSRALADSTDLQTILDLTARHTIDTVPATVARIALVEHDALVVRVACPIRVLDRDLHVDRVAPLSVLPFCRRALEQGIPIVLRDSPEMAELERGFLFAGGAQTLCLVPLCAGEQKLGFLMLGEAREERRAPFTQERVALANSIGDQLASALHRGLLHAQTHRRIEQLSALRTIDQAITSSLDLRLTLNIFLEQVVSQLHVDAADVLLLNPHTAMLEFAAERGFFSHEVKRMSVRLGTGHAGRAALEHRTISVPNHHDHDPNTVMHAWSKTEKFVAHCSVPLIAKGHVKGVLDVYHRAPIDANSDWLAFLELLAGQAAIAIDNATLFDNVQRSNEELANAYDATIEGWSRALDLRDKETEGHTVRVTELTLQLARAMGIFDGDLTHIRRGAMLHDIGKMGIPDNILFKPGTLTDAEWEIMRKHPQYAYELMSPIAYLRPALDIPYCHHEKWDGTGYPRGLKGEEIPLVARIFAVVDVWDALLSDRAYRPAWAQDKAREHILSLAGTHFYPPVVEAFFSHTTPELPISAERLAV